MNFSEMSLQFLIWLLNFGKNVISLSNMASYLILLKVTDSSTFSFWSKSSVDIDPRRIRLQSNSYTTNTLLDIVTAATVQVSCFPVIQNYLFVSLRFLILQFLFLKQFLVSIHVSPHLISFFLYSLCLLYWWS